MEKNGDDELRWFMVQQKNPTPAAAFFSSSSSSEKSAAVGNLSMPENLHHQLDGVTPAEILHHPHSFQFSQSEINPYYQNRGGVQINPSFPETLYDHHHPLESDFGRLNLSSPFVGPSNLGNKPDSSGFISPLSYPQPVKYTNFDLQRMRVQSAAAARGGEMGLYVQHPHHGSLDGFPRGMNSESITDFDFCNLYNNNRGAATIRNRVNRNGCYEFGHLGLIHSNRNGIKLESSPTTTTNNNILRSVINGIESENSSAILSSLYNSNNSCIQLNRSRQNNNNNNNQRCPSFTCLEEVRGKMYLVAKDQYGCRFLQRKFEEGKPEEIEMIFSEVKNHVRELMVDQFGNYLIQKFFEICSEKQMTEILLVVISDEHNLMAICLDMHGTRAMQKLLEHLTTQKQRSFVISALRGITVPLAKSMNGHHVIQHCLKFFSNDDNKHILNAIADNCLDIATDKSGCCVLQQCVAHAQGEPKERLVNEITANALVLSEHPYGNYVVQYIVGMRIPHVTSDILQQLLGSCVSLSMNKYGSNVVEKCLKESGEDQSGKIIKELIASQNFLMVLQDPYGNYVAQSALAISKGSARQAMVNLIQIHYPFLHSHPHGKRVLARTRGSKQRA